MRLQDRTGQVHGRLTVVRMCEGRRNGRVVWECRCECGKTHFVVAGALPHTKSCGCYNAELMATRRLSHGLCGTDEYKIWKGIHRRCHNKDDIGYKSYGGRGIGVCERWSGRDGAANFFADMGARPSKRHSVDRRDNDGDYCPKNCYWATRRQQALNTSRNRRVTFRGKTLTITEWAEETGIPKGTIRLRILEGWSTEDALTAAPGEGRRGPLTFRGKTQSVAAWSREIGITEQALAYRLDHGWTIEQAVTSTIQPGRRLAYRT